MTEFDKTQWINPEHSQGYVDGADIFIVERKRLLEILKSFYNYYIGNRTKKNVLDLGCGDGIIIHELLKNDSSIKATVIDGSQDMMNKARDRLIGFDNVIFIHGSFQDILNNDIDLEHYDFIYSSLAIHHLNMDEKTALFNTIYSHLNAGGYFLNTDVILAPSNTLEQWYVALWKQWIAERKSAMRIDDNRYDDIITAHDIDDNPDTLDDQIKALQTIGFQDVDCFYKYGIFAMYGGSK